jgi:hypothetical protein
MKSKIFWDITACGPLNVNRRFGGTYLLHVQDKPPACTLVSRCTYFFDPEDRGDMFHRNVGSQPTTRRYILEDCALHNHRCENLKFYILYKYVWTSTGVWLPEVCWK